jgi:hypothetical protein
MTPRTTSPRGDAGAIFWTDFPLPILGFTLIALRHDGRRASALVRMSV